MSTPTTATAYDELLGAQTELADAIEALQAAQSGIADATVALGEATGLL